MALRNFRVMNRLISYRKFSLIKEFDESVLSLPLREAVKYQAKNLNWTAKEFKNYVDAHANALQDLELIKPGDSIVIWMPESPEKHVALLSAVRLGAKIEDVDIGITDISDIRKFLKETDCKMIYVKPVHENHNYLLLLRKSIPELFYYDDEYGQLFHSKYYPKLRYIIQSGFDNEVGCLTFKNLFLPHQDMTFPTGNEDKINYRSFSKDINGDMIVSPITPYSGLLDLPAFSFAHKIITKQFFEISD